VNYYHERLSVLQNAYQRTGEKVKIAVASGKGGTGKTTVAVNLVCYIGKTSGTAHYFDCDVEEPNGHLFLKPDIERTEPVTINVPEIDTVKCTACGECVRFCRFNALIRIGNKVMFFPELCHGCGGCKLVCSEKAIETAQREIGLVRFGAADTTQFVDGYLSIGEAMSPPVIRTVLSHINEKVNTIIDAPPGTSCPVIAAIRNVDYVLLITEPTPFGLNDLALALDMVRELRLPHGVVVNRAEDGNRDAEEFCSVKGADLIARIPESREIASLYSQGETLIGAVSGIDTIFAQIWEHIRKGVSL
jgi:MinD superfamily P-loop ATPase